MAQFLHIDQTKKADAHYRYMMPSTLTKVEGKETSNGVKTVLPNIHDVCEALKRPEDLLCKFFAAELGTHATYIEADDKYLLMGAHTRDAIEKKVFQFITRFVLCQHCRNPETEVQVSPKQQVYLSCRSCGKNTLVGVQEKIYKNLVAYYNEKQSQPTQTAASTQPSGTATATAQSTETPSGKVVEAPTVDVAVENPLEVISKMYQNHSSVETIAGKIFDFKNRLGLKEKDLPRLAFRGTVSNEPVENFISGLRKNMELLKRFATDEEQRQVVMREVENYYCTAETELTERIAKLKASGETATAAELTTKFLPTAKKVPIALKMFFDEGFLTEQEILLWHQAPFQLNKAKTANKEGVPIPFLTEVRRLSEQLALWLGDGLMGATAESTEARS